MQDNTVKLRVKENKHAGNSSAKSGAVFEAKFQCLLDVIIANKLTHALRGKIESWSCIDMWIAA